MSVEGEAIADFVQALDTFVEQAPARRRDRALAPLERRLARQLAVYWRAQRRETIRRLRRYRTRFAEAGFAEAVTGDELERLWAQVARVTARRLVPVLDSTLRRALEAGIVSVLAQVSVDVDFDVRSPEAVAWLRARSADLVAGIDATTRDGIRRLLAQAGEEGWSWQRTARAIEDRFDGFSAPAAQAHLRTRAELVATTEMADAHGAGQHLTRQRLAEMGLGVRKTWHVAPGGRVCPVCDSNAAAGEIAQGDVFPGGVDREPQHPSCRCVVTTRIVVDEEENET